MLSGGEGMDATRVGEEERPTSLPPGGSQTLRRFQTRPTPAHRTGLCPVLARAEATQFPPTPCGLAPDNEKAVPLGETGSEARP